jgi:hypothetical protein
VGVANAAIVNVLDLAHHGPWEIPGLPSADSVLTENCNGYTPARHRSRAVISRLETCGFTAQGLAGTIGQSGISTSFLATFGEILVKGVTQFRLDIVFPPGIHAPVAVAAALTTHVVDD